MRTLDRAFLAANPAGDEKAELNLSHVVPAGIDVPDNQDGTRPSITIDVTADTYAQALGALSALHEDGGNELLNSLLGDVVTVAELDRYGSLQEAAPLLTERVHEVVIPFRTFTTIVDVVSTGPDGSSSESSVQVSITAPSLGSAIQAAVGMTKPNTLTQIAIAYSPVTDDGEDEYAGDDVLVVS